MRPTDIAAMRRAMAREAYVLDLVERRGMTYGQVKDLTGLSRNAVAGLVYRSRARAGRPMPYRLGVPANQPVAQVARPNPAPITPALRKLAQFDPLARRLVEERTTHAPHA